MVVTFITGNLKDCLLKEFILFKTSDYKITPYLSYYDITKIRVIWMLFKASSSYSLSNNKYLYCLWNKRNFNVSSYETLENCLFGAVSLAKDADIDKYEYSVYGIEFDGHGSFSFPGAGLGRNVIIFGAGMSSSTKIDNERKDILILGKGPTQGLEHTLSTEKMCLSLHYNKENSYLLVNDTEIIKFKSKISEIKFSRPLYLGNISKDQSVDSMKRTGLNGYGFDFSVDYDAIAADDILDIHEYLIKKNMIVWIYWKSVFNRINNFIKCKSVKSNSNFAEMCLND